MRGRAILLGGLVAAALVSGAAISTRSWSVEPRRVIGFVVGWDPASLRSLEAHPGDLTHVVTEGLFLGEKTGSLEGEVPRAVLATVRRHRLPLLAMLSNYQEGWRPERARPLWANAATRGAFVEKLAQEIERSGLQGVNIDFENLAVEDREGFTTFCAALGAAFRRRGLLLTVDLPVGRSAGPAGAYDPGALARSCDLVIAMVYDQHGATSRPGPVASRGWALGALADVRRAVPAGKLVVGLGAYGYDWGSSGPAAVTSFSRALTAARSHGATIQWDGEARAPFFRYTAGGLSRQVWFEDVASVSSRIAAAHAGGLAGVSVWRLGTEDPALWNALRAYRRGVTPRGFVDDATSLFDVVHMQGEGDFLTVSAGSAGGARRLEYRGGEVIEERYPELPAAFVVYRRGVPSRQEIALTFDDGPDPRYTPAVLDVLRRECVPAAFFVVGSHAQAYPDLIRRICAEGHLLGNHTYSHANMARTGVFQARLELNATQRIIEAITGRRTALFRPPYDIDSRPETRAELAPLLQASQEGYVTVAATVDPADWARPPADQIVARCLRQGRSGGVIVLHDAGGDRSATVRALPRLIHAFRARGCRFVALQDLLGRSREDLMPPSRPSWSGRLATLAVLGLAPVSRLCGWLALLGLGLSLLRAAVVPFLAWRHHRDRAALRWDDGFRPLVSVLVPAFNEERVIGRTLRYLLASDYPRLEVLVIDDGSTDGTQAAVAPFLADPRVRYLRRENRGKGAALNAGIRESRGEILVALDADTLFEPATVTRLVRHLADPRVGAVAGNVKVGNRKGLLTQWQSLEYLLGNNLEKRCFDALNCVTVVPGAVGAWRRAALERVGGFSSATLAEDTDLTFAVRCAGYRIHFEPSAIAWTEAPATLSCLAKQRLRWIFGTLQSLWKHRRAFLNLRAGTLGMVAMPYMLVFHLLLVLVGPLVDASVLAMGLMGQGARMMTLLAAFLAIEWLLAAIALAFERESRWPLLLVPPQRLVYRQLLFWFALRSALCALKGAHPGWQKLARRGTASVVTGSVLVVGFLLNPPPAHAVRPSLIAPGSAEAASSEATAGLDPAPVLHAPWVEPPARLPAALFEFDEFWDLVDRRGVLIGFQVGAYPQPVSDGLGRGAAVRSGTSTVAAASLDRVTILAMERFTGRTYRPGLANDTPLSSTWTSLKLTRRIAPGTLLSVSQLTGDAAATGLALSYGREWGPWEGEISFWSSTETAQMSLDTTYTGFGATLSRAVAPGLRLEVRLDGPLVRGQLAALTLHYVSDDRTTAALSVRRWYGTSLLELRAWRRVGANRQVGAIVSSEATLSLCAKQRL